MLDLEDLSLVPVAQKYIRVFTFGVITKNRRLFVALGKMINAAGVRQLMFYRHQLRREIGNMQFFHECAQIFDVPPVATVTIQQAVDTSIRCIPVSIGIVPTRLAEQRNRRIWRGNMGDV